MKLDEFKLRVRRLPFGKRLPTAVYLIRPADWCQLLPESVLPVPPVPPVPPALLVPPELAVTVERAERAAQPAADWNLLKCHTDQCALSFLSYPHFDTDPHPSLVEVTKINLNSGSIVRTDYRGRANPPILHRKEAFLPPGDPRLPLYAALTQAEEEAGLYRDPSRIGLRLQWQTLLDRLGLQYEGHRLVRKVTSTPSALDPAPEIPVQRHRTAIKRYDKNQPSILAGQTRQP